jgi:hypothetical protein
VINGLPSAVPLPVLLAEAHHHHVGPFDQGPRSDGVDPRPDVVVPERALLLAEDGRAGRVRGGVVGHRSREPDIEAGRLGAALDALTPVRVDLAREVDLPTHRHIVCTGARGDNVTASAGSSRTTRA